VGSTNLTTDDVVNPGSATPAAQVRLAGPDRYATASAISSANFAQGLPVAFVATGLNFPDALAGAAVAGHIGAPVLLVTTDAIPAATAAELARLAPAQIVVLGGSSVVSDGVLNALVPYATSGSVSRIAGADRFQTAAAVSAAYFGPGVDLAFIATGLNFPDALAGAAVAGHVGAPILLVTPSDLPAPTAAELTRLAPKRIVILGSTGVVGTSVAEQLAAFTTGSVDRLAGADRYATAAAISAAFFPPAADLALVATGLNFPDALAGAAVAGVRGAPILLVQQSSLPTATAAEAGRLAPKELVILGSSGVVGDGVAAQLAWLQAP
jgi:putative cell wall-binding protein